MLVQWLTNPAGSPAELLVLPVANASIVIKKPPLPVRRVKHYLNRAGLRSHPKFAPTSIQARTLLSCFSSQNMALRLGACIWVRAQGRALLVDGSRSQAQDTMAGPAPPVVTREAAGLERLSKDTLDVSSFSGPQALMNRQGSSHPLPCPHY